MFTANVLEAFTEPCSVSHYQVYVFFLIVVRFPVTVEVIGVKYVVFDFQPVESPISQWKPGSD